MGRGEHGSARDQRAAALNRLCIVALLLAALVGLTIHSYPAIFSGQALPVAADELMQMNPD